ncbi:MAG: AAA family ATPase [Syntrophobacteraceae bacterium]|nr:AAA family ATPase [Syntrophobacteraceae bacterium]
MSFKENNGIPIPQEDPYFYIDNETLDILERIHRIAQRHPVNVLVAGRQGCGKSSIVHQYAAVYQRPLATFQVGILSEPGQLFGEYALESGETKYKQFLFPQAIQTPGCVIHLEEINRPEHPKALNMLFSILSDDRQVWMDELGMLKVAEGVVFFATLNEGEEYVGTEMLDPALRDRFYVILMDYLPNAVEREVLIRKTGITEEQADQIMHAINLIRGNSEMSLDVSTRTSLMIAEMVGAGATLRESLVTSLQASKPTLESILLTLQMQKGFLEKTESEYLRFCRNVVL